MNTTRLVVILGSKAYADALEGMIGKIECEFIFIRTYQRELDSCGEAVESEKSRRKATGLPLAWD
jgi:hypothetical protein